MERALVGPLQDLVVVLMACGKQVRAPGTGVPEGRSWEQAAGCMLMVTSRAMSRGAVARSMVGRRAMSRTVRGAGAVPDPPPEARPTMGAATTAAHAPNVATDAADEPPHGRCAVVLDLRELWEYLHELL